MYSSNYLIELVQRRKPLEVVLVIGWEKSVRVLYKTVLIAIVRGLVGESDWGFPEGAKRSNKGIGDTAYCTIISNVLIVYGVEKVRSALIRCYG